MNDTNENLNRECEVTGSTETKNELPHSTDTTPRKIVGIYGLQNKLKPDKWYIGQSIDIDGRWNGYRLLRCKGQTKIYHALLKYGYGEFNKVVLENCELNESILNDREDFYVKKYNSIENGYNIREAGSRGRQSEETKNKCRLANLGRKLSVEHKRKIGLKSLGRKLSEKTKHLISTKCLGKKRTDETREKMSRSKMGIKLPPFTDEHKRKISISSIGNVGNLGRKFSEETKRKMAEARGRWWVERYKKVDQCDTYRNDKAVV